MAPKYKGMISHKHSMYIVITLNCGWDKCFAMIKEFISRNGFFTTFGSKEYNLESIIIFLTRIEIPFCALNFNVACFWVFSLRKESIMLFSLRKCWQILSDYNAFQGCIRINHFFPLRCIDEFEWFYMLVKKQQTDPSQFCNTCFC